MASRKSQRMMCFPPRFDQIQVGATHWLENKLTARMGQRKQQHIIGAMGIQVIQHDVNTLDGGGNPFFDGLQQVEKVGDGAPPRGQGQSFTSVRLQRAKNIATRCLKRCWAA